MFKKAKKISTGIDISSGGFSLVAVSKEDGKLNLENFAYNYFEQNVFMDGMIIKPEVFADVVKKTLEENNFDTKSVNVGIASNITFSKIITFPDIPREELKLIVQQEAAKNFPLSIEEMNFDFEILENTRSDNKVDVIMCALPKKIAKNFVDSFSLAGVNVDAIDVGSYAMIRTLANAEMINNPNLTYVSVLVGYENTDINIVNNGMPVYSHNIQTGKRNILESLKRELHLMYWEEAETMLPNLNIILSETDFSADSDLYKASNAAKNIFINIASEIQKTINFYTSQKGESATPDKIILGGSGICIGNIDKYLSNKLKIDTVVCEALKNISYSRELIENRAVPLNVQALTTIVGLALKGLQD